MPGEPEEISVLIVGGQGTYRDGHYYTEFPDRDLAIQHCAGTKRIVDENFFTHVVFSGGFTQAQTPELSEAKSFLNMWTETQTKPIASIFYDEVALDSAENVIFGLMALRLAEPKAKIRRIGFYSLWQFKKQRMNSLAKALGIENQFYFYFFALAELANAGRLAQEGEEKQLASMAATGDYLLRGKEWEEKRRNRYKGDDPYDTRDKKLRERFEKVFDALDGLQKTTVSEVRAYAQDRDANEVLNEIRKQKLDRFRAVFAQHVLLAG